LPVYEYSAFFPPALHALTTASCTMAAVTSSANMPADAESQKTASAVAPQADSAAPMVLGRRAATQEERLAFRYQCDTPGFGADASMDGDDKWAREIAREQAGESLWQWIAIVALMIAVWWSAAVLITITIKETVGSKGKHKGGPFPYPFALTAITNAVTAPAAWLISRWTKGRDELPAPKMEWQEVGKLIAIGCLQGAELGCNNKAMEYLPVSIKVMLHSMFVLFVMVTARVYGLEPLECFRATAGALILCGGVLQGWSVERRDMAGAAARKMELQHAHGALLMLIAMLLGAQRWALVQIVIQRQSSHSALGRLTKLQFAARVLPVAGLVCLALASVFETPAFSAEALQQPALQHSVPIVATGIILLTVVELGVVRRTSAVALQVLVTLHQIPIAFVSAARFHERVSTMSVCGFGLCLLAAFIYAAARRRESQMKADQVDKAAQEEHARNGKAAGRDLELRVGHRQPPKHGEHFQLEKDCIDEE